MWGDDDPVRLMGVLNVTPDSFSDGGLFASAERAVAHGLALIEAGADLLDVGGESSRPGAEPVSAAAEIDRVLPVIEGLRARSDVPLSVDTVKSSVAAAALEAGADIINDITGLTGDPEMAALAARSRAGVVVMHMRGTPRTMQEGDLSSAGIVDEVADWLAGRVASLVSRGVAADAICLDPGVGFGKTAQQNLQLVAQVSRFGELGRPVLLGVSRKSFLGEVTGRPVGERSYGTAAACAAAVLAGVQLLRVHEVGEMKDVARVGLALRRAG